VTPFGRGALGAAAISVLAVGCGSSSSSAGQDRASSGAARAPRARLTVTYFPHGTATSARERWRLTCRPTGGDHPRRALACAELAAHPSALGPARRPCPLLEVRGAPQALVSGTVGGRAMQHVFRPSCDPAWSSLHALLRGR
jgi:Subtilisin inhibitor-like